MLLSFQRPSPPGRRGFPLEDAPRAVAGSSGQKSIDASRLGAQSHPTWETRPAPSAWRKVAQSASDCVYGAFAGFSGPRFTRIPSSSGQSPRACSDQVDACKAPLAELQHPSFDEASQDVERIRVERLTVDPHAALRERAASL
jgi:hypothetical protein